MNSAIFLLWVHEWSSNMVGGRKPGKKVLIKRFICIIITLILTQNIKYIQAFVCFVVLLRILYSASYSVLENRGQKCSLSLLGEILIGGTGWWCNTSNSFRQRLPRWNNMYEKPTKTPLETLKTYCNKIRQQKHSYVLFIGSMCFIRYFDLVHILTIVGFLLLSTLVYLSIEEKKYYFQEKWGKSISFSIYTYHAPTHTMKGIFTSLISARNREIFIDTLRNSWSEDKQWM